jgi:simple sugar transport system permease protein
MEVITFLQFVLTGAIRSAASVQLATMGELVSEKAGIVNLGTEGSMVVGACVGFMVVADTGNPWLAVVAALLAGAAISLIHAYLVVSRNANQLASGLALGFFGLGLTALIGRRYVAVNIDGIPNTPVPILADIPFAGPILFQHDPLTYVAFLIVPLIWFFLYRTRWGLALRAVGEDPTVAFSTGKNPVLIQYAAVCFGGALAALGGAQLSLAYTSSWVENMSAGRGFIAVALVIFGMWRPGRATIGALLFGGAVALQFQLQPLGVKISPFILLMLPYALTLLALWVWGRRSQYAAPAGLAAVFGRSE